MAKKGFEASGRMSAEKFEKLFRTEFDVYCDILDEKGKIAKQSASLASLRPKDFKAPGKVDFSLSANMLTVNVLNKFNENFGIELQIYKLSRPDDKDTLASLRKGVLLENQKDLDEQSDDNDFENVPKISSKVTGINEIMLCHFDMEKGELLKMDSDELQNLVDTKLLEESFQVFMINPSEFSLEHNNKIISDEYENSEEDRLEKLEESKVRLVFWERLSKFNINVDLPNIAEKGNDLKLVLNGNTFGCMEDYCIEAFTDYRFEINGNDTDSSFESESSGEIREKLIYFVDNNNCESLSFISFPHLSPNEDFAEEFEEVKNALK